MKFFISDTHFGHKNVIRFDNRPFASVEEMDAALTALWNGRVADKDEVYILGDFSYRAEIAPSEYLKKLKGRLHLITGNHDKKLLADAEAMGRFESVHEIHTFKEDGIKYNLCHYPMASWNGSERGAWLVHGHIHNRVDEVYEILHRREDARVLNAGCMINGYMPVTLGELVENNRRFNAMVRNGRGG